MSEERKFVRKMPRVGPPAIRATVTGGPHHTDQVVVLALAPDADPAAVYEQVKGLVARFDEAAWVSGGTGMALDVVHSTASAGAVVVRLLPALPARGPEQAEVVRQQLRQLPGVVDATISTAA
jgi:hypothetical protein